MVKKKERLAHSQIILEKINKKKENQRAETQGHENKRRILKEKNRFEQIGSRKSESKKKRKSK